MKEKEILRFGQKYFLLDIEQDSYLSINFYFNLNKTGIIVSFKLFYWDIWICLDKGAKRHF